MDLARALRELAVTAGDLTADQAARLDEDGFLPLPGILSTGQLQVIRRRLAELSAAEASAPAPRCTKRRARTGWPTW